MTQTSGPAAPVVDLRGQTKNLVVATAAFAISFWAWNMIAPLAVTYTQELGLDGNQKALLVATPVLVGALGRILAGALTDRFGGRLMMPTLILASVPFVLLVAVAGNARSYGLMLLLASSSGSRGRRSRSACRSSTPGTGRSGAGSRRACSAPGWAAPPSPRSSRRGSSRGSATP